MDWQLTRMIPKRASTYRDLLMIPNGFIVWYPQVNDTQGFVVALNTDNLYGYGTAIHGTLNVLGLRFPAHDYILFQIGNFIR